MKKALKDLEFIMPVRIDDVALTDLPIQIHQFRHHRFFQGLGAKFADLVDTLAKASVASSPTSRLNLTADAPPCSLPSHTGYPGVFRAMPSNASSSRSRHA